MQVSWWVGLLATLLFAVRGQPDGWRMVDRFYGFRYELSGRNLDTASIIESILNEADNYACFGWVQVSPAGSIVGEARCAKARGKILQEKLKNISPQISKTDFLVYEDTKIRLHFSSFKVLPAERETCFIDVPHQCREYSKAHAASSGASTNFPQSDAAYTGAHDHRQDL
jgi:hypothetical protein